jgi:hypothetical protein
MSCTRCEYVCMCVYVRVVIELVTVPQDRMFAWLCREHAASMYAYVYMCVCVCVCVCG